VNINEGNTLPDNKQLSRARNAHTEHTSLTAQLPPTILNHQATTHTTYISEDFMADYSKIIANLYTKLNRQLAVVEATKEHIVAIEKLQDQDNPRGTEKKKS